MIPADPVPGLQKIGSCWLPGDGSDWASTSFADDRQVWTGRFASSSQVQQAISAAQDAFPKWCETALQDRMNVCRNFAEVVTGRREELTALIARETGKPLWEADLEVGTVIGKINNSIDALLARRWTTTEQQGDYLAVTRFRPHGIMLVLGPFNLPAHLPGSHIVPAILAGNTIVFKPSELTPGVGQWLVQAWQRANLPDGVINLVHGDASIAQAAVADDRVAGVLFTGSRRAGESLHRAFAGKPHKVLALEMGGNNPLVVHKLQDLDLAIITVIHSAFITSGQRCTCARRLILTEQAQPDRFILRLKELVGKIRVGYPLDHPQPFMGPVIRQQQAERMLAAQEKLRQAGASVVLNMELLSSHSSLLSPGLIDVTGLPLEDDEHFGPLLSIQRARTFDDAIELANRTEYGLAVGLITERVDDFHYFLHRVRAGVANWNRQSTGASGRLPFGGIGASGNHQPSGFFAADYCSYPVASLESHELSEARKLMPGLDEVGQACSWK